MRRPAPVHKTNPRPFGRGFSALPPESAPPRFVAVSQSDVEAILSADRGWHWRPCARNLEWLRVAPLLGYDEFTISFATSIPRHGCFQIPQKMSLFVVHTASWRVRWSHGWLRLPHWRESLFAALASLAARGTKGLDGPAIRRADYLSEEFQRPETNPLTDDDKG